MRVKSFITHLIYAESCLIRQVLKQWFQRHDRIFLVTLLIRIRAGWKNKRSCCTLYFAPCDLFYLNGMTTKNTVSDSDWMGTWIKMVDCF